MVFIILLGTVLVLLFAWGVWKLSFSIVERQNRRYERQQQEQAKAAAEARVKLQKEADARKEKEQREEEERRAKKLQPQRDLIQRFVDSMTTKEMLLVICNGDPQQNLPREIVIYNNSITGYHADGVYTFDFASNRVHSFSPIITTMESIEEIQYVLRPQVAMAEAINQLLVDQYAIYDNADWKNDNYQDCDGELHFIKTYTSNNVKMVLKNTLPNRSF